MASLDLRLLFHATPRGFVVGMGGASRRVRLVAVSSLLVIAVACGQSNDETLKSPAVAPADSTTTSVEPMTTTAELTTTPEPMTTTAELTTTPELTTTAELTTAQPTTTAEPTTTAAPATAAEPTTTLPEEPVDWLVAGTVAEVPGVAFDETFVIRMLPGGDQPAAASLPPLTELVLTGNGRDLDQGSFFLTWAEVTAGGVTGWIPWRSLVYLGAPRDVTAEAVSAFGQLPSAPTMLELGTIVMDELAPLDPDSAGAKLVRATEPSAGPTSEVVYDEFPGEKFGDDAALGARHKIIGRQVPASDLPATGFGSSLAYELVSVEVRSLCTRGVSLPTGVCV